jgi:hypothetical protein
VGSPLQLTSLLCNKALAGPPGLLKPEKIIAPFGVTLSELCRMANAGVTREDDHSHNFLNKTHLEETTEHAHLSRKPTNVEECLPFIRFVRFSIQYVLSMFILQLQYTMSESSCPVFVRSKFCFVQRWLFQGWDPPFACFFFIN